MTAGIKHLNHGRKFGLHPYQRSLKQWMLMKPFRHAARVAMPIAYGKTTPTSYLNSEAQISGSS